MGQGNRLTRIGVFYDGNFFFHVSNYYNYNHPRRARISITGLHEFIRHEVARKQGFDVNYCQIVDAHYFRGRVAALDADDRGLLLKERLFDDVLLREGIVTHYLPLGRDGEKGIDVWFALEAYELAIYKRFDVSVLVAGDGDFLPLVRKLNTLGTRVMLLAWDFKYTDHNARERETRTAQVLLDEATFPIMMHQVIDDRARRTDPLVEGLFVSPRSIGARSDVAQEVDTLTRPSANCGTIKVLKEGYGFIVPDQGGSDIFFFHAEVLNADFNDLSDGDRVSYDEGRNDQGMCAVRVQLENNRT